MEKYKEQSVITDPGKYKDLFDVLPNTVPEIVKVVQGLVIDKDFLSLYNVPLTDSRKEDVDSRYVEFILERLVNRNNQSLIKERSPKNRFVGSCRDYAILLCSMLRHKGISSRLRCGFDRYFGIKPGLYDDHWVCEYWNEQEARWVLVDANLDNTVIEKYKIGVKPLDIPREKFLVAGDGWKLIREGKVDPNSFGVSSIDIKGQWFVRGSLIKDLAALNMWEALPWDYWGIATKANEDFPEEDLVLLDDIARMTVKADLVSELESLFNRSECAIPSQIKSYSPFGGEKDVLIKK